MGHTPGPWHLQDRPCNRGTCGMDIIGGDGTIVARIPDGATMGGGHAFPRQRANADLLMAAPDLLDAGEEHQRLLLWNDELMADRSGALWCEHASEYIEQMDACHAAMGAAIAKATPDA